MKIFAKTEITKPPVKNAQCFPSLSKNCYINILVLAKRGSGKTNALWNMIDCASTLDTFIRVFQTTAQYDQTLKGAISSLSNKSINPDRLYITSDDITKKTIESLQVQTDEIYDQHNLTLQYNAQTDKQPSNISLIDKLTGAQQQAPQKKKPIFKTRQFHYPYFINVFDDLDTKSFSLLYNLIKTNRHQKQLNFFSCHSFTDLPPRSRQNINQILIFAGQPTDRLKMIYDAYLPVKEFSQFQEIYTLATNEPFSFLLLDLDSNRMFKRFEQEFLV